MILTDPNAIRLKCRNVEPEEYNDFKALLEKELSLAKDGIGLALPQLGIPVRMAIIRVPIENRIVSIDLVNCKISKKYDEFTFDREGCLSFPDIFVKSRRHREIVVTDNMVEPYRFVATDLISVAIQHELDHLDGRLLPEIDINYSPPPRGMIK